MILTESGRSFAHKVQKRQQESSGPYSFPKSEDAVSFPVEDYRTIAQSTAINGPIENRAYKDLIVNRA